MADAENKSNFEKMLDSILTGTTPRKIEGYHPEDFLIIMDSIASLFFHESKEKKIGLEGFIDYDGLKIEFSEKIKFPSIRKDRLENYRIIVLPDMNQSLEEKQLIAKEALKEFSSFELIERYNLCLQIFHTFSEKELVQLAKTYDPLKRKLSIKKNESEMTK